METQRVFTLVERLYAVFSSLEPGFVNLPFEYEVSFSLFSCKRTSISLSVLFWSEFLFKVVPSDATIGRHPLFEIKVEWNFLDLEI